ncbi:hypothetical protein [Streptomyces californicus]|uniref:hypothetical protein n=1 Tax=Streptomyces californicus TaxID=67351 RepID=UPI0033AE0420
MQPRPVLLDEHPPRVRPRQPFLLALRSLQGLALPVLPQRLHIAGLSAMMAWLSSVFGRLSTGVHPF